jgi:transcriptional regulator with XRE-family HTH domain
MVKYKRREVLKMASEKRTLGEYLKERRTEKDLSLRRVSELSGISHTEIKRIEDGLRRQPSPQILRSLAKALDAPYEELMELAGYIDDMQEESTGVAPAGIAGAEDLSPEELDRVNQFIAFLKTQRK